MGHLVYKCQKKGRGAPRESTMKVATQSVNVVVSEETTTLPSKRERVAELRHQLQETEVDVALTESAVTMHNVQSSGTNDACLSPVLTVEVEGEGTSTKAIVDTGSPVTIVSLTFLVNALARQQPPKQTLLDWRKEVEKHLRPPSLPLKNYGGGEINQVREITVNLVRGSYAVESTVQVHTGAPVDMLSIVSLAWWC